MADKETIADIIAEMRSREWDSPSFNRFAYNAAHQYACEWADRIAAAHERERGNSDNQRPESASE